VVLDPTLAPRPLRPDRSAVPARRAVRPWSRGPLGRRRDRSGTDRPGGRGPRTLVVVRAAAQGWGQGPW